MSSDSRTCEEYWALISAKMDGEIGSEERVALSDHLQNCAACRSVEEGFLLDDSSLRKGFASRRDTALRIADRLSTVVSTRAPRRAPRWLSLALASAAGFGIACVLFSPWEKRGGAPKNDVVIEDKGAQPAKVAPPARIESIARLALSTGRVEMLGPGKGDWQPVPTGGELEAGTRIRTDSQVLCELVCSDGSTIRLNEQSELSLDQARQHELKRGRLWTHVEAGESPFQVSAAGSTIVALGTKFDVESREGTARVIVLEGVTKIVGLKGESSLLRFGERATITGGA